MIAVILFLLGVIAAIVLVKKFAIPMIFSLLPLYLTDKNTTNLGTRIRGVLARLSNIEHRHRLSREYPLFVLYLSSISSEEDVFAHIISGRVPALFKAISRELTNLRMSITKTNDVSLGVKSWLRVTPSKDLANLVRNLMIIDEMGLDKRYFIRMEVKASLEHLEREWQNYGRILVSIIEAFIISIFVMEFVLLISIILAAGSFLTAVWSILTLFIPLAMIIASGILYMVQPAPRLIQLKDSKNILLLNSSALLSLVLLVTFGWNYKVYFMIPALVMLTVVGVVNIRIFNNYLDSISKIPGFLEDLSEIVKLGIPVDRALLMIDEKRYPSYLSRIIRELKALMKAGLSLNDASIIVLKKRVNEPMSLLLFSLSSSSSVGRQYAGVLDNLALAFDHIASMLKSVCSRVKLVEYASAFVPGFLLLLYKVTSSYLHQSLSKIVNSGLASFNIVSLDSIGILVEKTGYELAILLPVFAAFAIRGSKIISPSIAIALALMFIINFIL